MSPQQIAERFLFERLQNPPDPESFATAYAGPFPEQIAYPAISFRFERAQEVAAQSQVQLSVLEYRVFARAFGWEYPFELQDRLDEILGNTNDVVEGHAVFCQRYEPYSFSDRIGEVPVRDAGARYRIYISHPR